MTGKTGLWNALIRMLNLPTHSLTRSLCWRYIQNIRGRFSFCHLDSRCKLRCTDSVYFAHVLFGSNLLLILSTRTSFSPLHLLYSQLIPFWIYLKFILVYLKFIFVIWHFLQWCLAEWKCLCDLVADGSTEHLTTVEVDGGTDQQMEDKSVVTQDFIMSLKIIILKHYCTFGIYSALTLLVWQEEGQRYKNGAGFTGPATLSPP